MPFDVDTPQRRIVAITARETKYFLAENMVIDTNGIHFGNEGVLLVQPDSIYGGGILARMRINT